MALNLSRNSLLYVSTVETGFDDTNTWEIPIQDGFSFGQQMSSTDVSVNEAGPKPTRGSKRFNDSLDPVDWSIATYIRPYTKGAAGTLKNYMVDGILWQALASPFAPDWDTPLSKVVASKPGFAVAFTENQVHELLPLTLYFKVDNTWIKIAGARVSQAEISVDIEDIAMTNWSGQGTRLETLAVAPDMAAVKLHAARTGISNISYIKNKLTLMTLSSNVSGSQVSYDIPITGANITINNNITFLTPTTLAEVDQPIGSFTGTFEVSGTFDCYLNTKANGSMDFMKHMQASRSVTNAANLVLRIGGATTPFANITIPAAQMAVPDMSIDDVISSSVEFKAIPSDLAAGDETTLLFAAKTE